MILLAIVSILVGALLRFRGSAFATTRATHSGEELQISAEMPGFDSKPVPERPPKEEQQPPSKSGTNLC